MATPLNTLSEALLLSPWHQGTAPRDMEGESLGSWELAGFSIEQLAQCLQDAADERDELLRGTDPSTLPAYRQPQVKRGEGWLFNALLCELRGYMDAALGEQADIVSGPGATGARGADTPPKEQRHDHWRKFAKAYRDDAIRLIGGFKFSIERTSLGYDEQTHPYEFILTGAESYG